MIYFAQMASGAIKIGCTENLKARISQLESHYGPMTLLGTQPGDFTRERKLHRQFSHLRFGRTEQFKPTAELMEFIGRPLLVHPDPDAVDVTPPPAQKLIQRVIKMTQAYSEWLDAAARLNRTDAAQLIDQALELYAKERGLPIPPSRTS